jgi:hypothetical protein
MKPKHLEEGGTHRLASASGLWCRDVARPIGEAGAKTVKRWRPRFYHIHRHIRKRVVPRLPRKTELPAFCFRARGGSVSEMAEDSAPCTLIRASATKEDPHSLRGSAANVQINSLILRRHRWLPRKLQPDRTKRVRTSANNLCAQT